MLAYIYFFFIFNGRFFQIHGYMKNSISDSLTAAITEWLLCFSQIAC